MRIAVHTGILLNDNPEGDGYFMKEVLKRIIKIYPDHEFIIIAGHADAKRFLFGKNVTVVITPKPTRYPLLWKLWYDMKIPALLRKYKADVFIAGDGICSLITKTPQCLIVNDLSFLYFPSFIKRSDLFFLKRYTKRFLQRANSIVTGSEFVKKDILSRYAIKEEKITVVPNAVKGIFYPLNENEKEKVKRKYTGGKNYFVYAGAIHPRKNLINLLKAFSVFKKRQQSDWKLVLAGNVDRNYKSFAENLRTYKYRDDIVMTGRVEEGEIVRLTGSAYAFFYPSFWEGSGVQVLEAMNSHIPVVTSFNSSMQEIAGEAALYINPAEHKDIADKMMLLYKDESLRNSLIEKGKVVAAQYSWEKTADLFWQGILKALK